MSADEVAALASKLAESVCGALLECLGQQKLQAFVGREDCQTRFVATLAQDDFGSLDASVSRGRVKLERSALAQCYTDTRALGCKIQSERLPASCQQALAGQVASGGTCSIGADCSGDSYCALGDCPRTCAARLAAGGACQRDEECVSGLTCLGQRCAVPAAVGEACAGSSGAVCALGTSCSGSTTTQAGTCQANAEIQVGELSAVCTPTGALCREGLSCAFDGGSGFVCQAAVGSGAACLKALPSQCPHDEYCSAQDITVQGTCQALPGESQPCVLSGECAAGYLCVASVDGTPVCRQLRSAGETCSEDAVCRTGSCAGGTCAVRAVCE